MPRYAVRVIRLTFLAAAASSAFAQGALIPGELAHQVTFEQPSPFIRNAVLISRLLTPRQRERQLSALAANAEALAAYPLDLGAQRFSVYLPKQQPAAGYGLLVFIPPWKAQCLLDLHATHSPLKRQHEPLDFPGNFPGDSPGDFGGGGHRVFG